MNASESVAPPARVRDTFPKKAPIEAVRGAAVGLSGVMVRAKDFTRGYSLPGIQLVELRPSWLSSLYIMRKSDAKTLTERVSCCAASGGLTEDGK